MRAVYQMDEAAEPKTVLLKLHDELMQENPRAAGNLAEGLDETLTTLELRVPTRLNRSLSSTNEIESVSRLWNGSAAKSRAGRATTIHSAGSGQRCYSSNRAGISFMAIVTCPSRSMPCSPRISFVVSI